MSWSKDKKSQYMKEYMSSYRETPMFKFTNQRSHAKRRGILWTLSFEDWWGIWESFWDKRGHQGDDYCMARFGDTGPYSIDNVRIITKRENDREREQIKRSCIQEPVRYQHLQC